MSPIPPFTARSAHLLFGRLAGPDLAFFPPFFLKPALPDLFNHLCRLPCSPVQVYSLIDPIGPNCSSTTPPTETDRPTDRPINRIGYLSNSALHTESCHPFSSNPNYTRHLINCRPCSGLWSLCITSPGASTISSPTPSHCP